MQEHIVAAYSRELNDLQVKIVSMSEIVECSFAKTLKILKDSDKSYIDSILAKETDIDDLMIDIRKFSIVLIARRQPVAVDLRTIISAIEIAGNLERIGDLVENICLRLRRTDLDGLHIYLQSLHKLGVKSLKQLNLATKAYVDNDLEMMRQIKKQDDVIDEDYFSLYKDLTNLMQSDNSQVAAVAELLFIDKNLERIADHAGNIADTGFYRNSGFSS